MYVLSINIHYICLTTLPRAWILIIITILYIYIYIYIYIYNNTNNNNNNYNNIRFGIKPAGTGE